MRRGRGRRSGSRGRAHWRRGAPRRSRPAEPAGRKATRVERSASSRADHLDHVREELTAPLGGGGGMIEGPGRPAVECSQEAGERRRGPPPRVESRRTGLWLEPAVRLVGGLREIARRRHRKPLGVGHDESPRRVRPAEPLLARDREVVEPGGRDGNRPDGLRAVDQHGNARLRAKVEHGQDPAGRPDHLREREQPRPRRHRSADRLRVGRHDDDSRAGRGQRTEEAEVLVGRRHDLVVRAEPEPAEHDVAALRGARRQRRPGVAPRRRARRCARAPARAAPSRARSSGRRCAPRGNRARARRSPPRRSAGRSARRCPR